MYRPHRSWFVIGNCCAERLRAVPGGLPVCQPYVRHPALLPTRGGLVLLDDRQPVRRGDRTPYRPRRRIGNHHLGHGLAGLLSVITGLMGRLVQMGALLSDARTAD